MRYFFFLALESTTTKAVFVSGENEYWKMFYTMMCVWEHM